LAFSTCPPCPSIGFVCDVDAGLRGASRSRAPWGRVDQTARPSWSSLLLRRLNPVCAVRRPWCVSRLVLRRLGSRPFGRRTPLMGLSEIRPSIDLGAWCPLPVVPLLRRAAGPRHPEGFCVAARSHLRPGLANSRVRSALVVPPDFDGLLHLALCRFVAPCCRSWGSPCFRSSESLGVARPVRPPRRGTGLGSSRVRLAPEGAPRPCLSPTLSPGSCVPGGARSLVRRGSPSCLLDLSQWRSTLRSFPLASSCAASTVPSCRVPDLLPWPGGPGRGVVPGALVGLSARATAVVAFSSLLPGSSSSLVPLACAWGFSAVASAGRSTSRLSSADESVASTGCCNPMFARCSLGLRPLKACLHDEGAVGRSTAHGVGAPFPLRRFGVETRRLCRGVLGASVPAGRSPSSLASQRGVQVRASLTEPPSWLAPCPASCPAGVRYRRPDRHLLPRECRPEGRRQVPHPVACLHHGRVVILSRILRRSPSRARRLVGRTVRVRGPSWSSDDACPRAFVAGSSVSAPPASAASCLGRGPSLVDPSSRRAEASTCGAEPRSETLRRVPVPPSPAVSCPRARWGGAPACQPKLACYEVPRRPLLPKQGGSLPRGRGTRGSVARPRAGSGAVHKGRTVRVARTRRRDGVPTAGPASMPPEGDMARRLAVACRKFPRLARSSCLRIAPEVAGPVGTRVNHRPSRGFSHVKDRSEKSVPLGG